MDLAHFWNTSGAYQINQSLRFDGSARFSKTFASDGNRKTFTISFWVKNTTTTIGNVFNQSRTNLRLNTTNAAFVLNAGYGSTNAFLTSNASFRDPSAWYHFVLAFDTTQSTSSDRVKIWVNNQLQTYSSATYPPQNQDLDYNSTNTAYIGAENTSEYLNGYLAEYYSIDGTALTPSSFGETDTITGAWIPKKYSGSFGTNGFYLKFESSGIGTDSSGNGNTWTASGFSTSGTGTDVMSDTPTNNFPTIISNNPNYTYVTTTPTDGNLVASFYPNAGTGNPGAPALTTFTIPTTGKWYYEFTVSGALNHTWGIVARNDGNNLYNFTLGTRAFWGWYHIYQAGYPFNGNDSVIYSPGTGTPSGGASLTSGDVIGVAIDFSNSSITFTKNGSSYASITSCNFSNFTEVVPQWGTATNGISGATITLNAGQRAFAYTPPSGHKAVCTANLPEPTIKDGSKYFDTKLYTANNQTAQTITGLGFSPDLLWFKPRSRTEHHYLYDQVRGAGNRVSSSQTITEVTGDNSLTAFTSDGFSLGADGAGIVNYGTDSMVAWAWDANGAGSSNTAGTITSTVSANATAGFSIVTYTGNATSNATVGHGLGVAPGLIIVKNRSSSNWWKVYHKSLGIGYYINLNDAYGASNSGVSSVWGSSAPSSTVFSLGSGADGSTNASGNNYVAYCFSEVAGYSKFGSYTGNGSSDGPFVFCGFRPKLLIWKRTDSSANWFILDAARNTYNVVDKEMYPDQSAAESTFTDVDFLSNGFKLRASAADRNGSGATFIFAAWAELPFKYANAR